MASDAHTHVRTHTYTVPHLHHIRSLVQHARRAVTLSGWCAPYRLPSQGFQLNFCAGMQSADGPQRSGMAWRRWRRAHAASAVGGARMRLTRSSSFALVNLAGCCLASASEQLTVRCTLAGRGTSVYVYVLEPWLSASRKIQWSSLVLPASRSQQSCLTAPAANVRVLLYVTPL